MQSLFNGVLILAFAATVYNSPATMNWDSNLKEDISFINALPKMLVDINKERSFDTLLVVHQREHDEPILEAIYENPVPKVLVETGHNFEFIRKFNSEIFAVIIMSRNLDLDLLSTAAETLNYMRQTRILIIASNILVDTDNFQENLLKICKTYKMTNVLLKFVPIEGDASLKYHKLKPYPEHHWQLASANKSHGGYYHQHWWNMRNATVTTFTDHHTLRSFPYEDARGNVKLNGFVARLILLFGEYFNANLKMYQSSEVAADTVYTAVNQMVEDNLVDIPMTMSSSHDGKWLYRSYPYELYESLIMVPCAQTLTIREVYSILLNEYFFGCIIICTLILSIAHSLVDCLLDGLLRPVNFLFNYRVLPGILGQSFQPRNSPWLGHKLVYLLVFFVGLNISTEFGANIQTLFTSPPYHHQIETFDDLNHSPLRILVLTAVFHDEYILWKPLAKWLVLTDNVTYFEDNRNSFNTSTAYDVASSSWEILKRKQQHLSNKVFCIPDSMIIARAWPRAIQLQQHSEYKEPLDYLIHRVHELGLKDAWYTSVFMDMLRTKRLSTLDPKSDKGAKSLSVNDLFWIWMIVLTGLSVSFVVFLVELWIKREKWHLLKF